MTEQTQPSAPDFMSWWEALNTQLAKGGQYQALFGDAKYLHRSGFTVAGALEEIIRDRAANDARLGSAAAELPALCAAESSRFIELMRRIAPPTRRYKQ
jgi:hypothetical protein